MVIFHFSANHNPTSERLDSTQLIVASARPVKPQIDDTLSRAAIPRLVTRAPWPRALRSLLLATTAACAIIVASPPRAVAADLPAAAPAPGDIAARPGNLHRALAAVMRLARWAKWWAWAQELADAIADLLKILDDSKRAADALRKIEALEARIATLERDLAGQPSPGPQQRIMMKSLRDLQAQLAISRRGYQTCQEGQHRVGARCHDKRLSTAPTTK